MKYITHVYRFTVVQRCFIFFMQAADLQKQADLCTAAIARGDYSGIQNKVFLELSVPTLMTHILVRR